MSKTLTFAVLAAIALAALSFLAFGATVADGWFDGEFRQSAKYVGVGTLFSAMILAGMAGSRTSAIGRRPAASTEN